MGYVNPPQASCSYHRYLITGPSDKSVRSLIDPVCVAARRHRSAAGPALAAALEHGTAHRTRGHQPAASRSRLPRWHMSSCREPRRALAKADEATGCARRAAPLASRRWHGFAAAAAPSSIITRPEGGETAAGDTDCKGFLNPDTRTGRWVQIPTSTTTSRAPHHRHRPKR